MNRPASQPNPLTWVWNAFPKTLECFSDWKREGGGVGLMLSSRRRRSPAEGESLTILTGPHLRQCFCLLALWLWTLANGTVCILYTFYTVSIDKFLRRKIPFLHLYSKTIEVLRFMKIQMMQRDFRLWSVQCFLGFSGTDTYTSMWYVK